MVELTERTALTDTIDQGDLQTHQQDKDKRNREHHRGVEREK